MRRRSLALLALVAALAAVAAQASAQGAGTQLDGGPAGVTTDGTPTFTFSSPEPGARFECRLDAGAWAPCSSPHTLTLADGTYTFSVRAIDRAGNVDPTPASRTFTVDRSAVDTFIDAGPNGATRDTTPSFTFGSETTGATYECRIDGPGSPLPAFAECSAPFTAPELRSGAYVLSVRAKAPGGKLDVTPAARAFSVDADPPETTIVDGPRDGGETGVATPTFRYASEPGATYECRLDNRAGRTDSVAWGECPTGGFTTPALAGGEHTFEVRAIDAVGNVDATPAKRTFHVRVCERVVRFQLVEAEAECLVNVGTQDRKVWESENEVKLNGLPLPAPGPAKVVLEEPTDGDPGGTLAVSDITLRLAGVTLYRGALKWKLPKGGAGESGELKRIDLSGAGQSLFGMKVKGDAVLRLERRGAQGDQYKSVFALNVALPEVFRAGPNGGGAGGVTGAVAINVDKQGVHLDGLKIAVDNAYIGNLGVKHVCLSYVAAGATAVAPCTAPKIGNGNPQPFLECKSDSTADRWDGTVSIVLPTASGTELGLWGGLRAGRLSHAGAYVDRLGTLVPLAPGVFLERVALGVCLEPPPFQIKGATAIAFGPSYNGKAGVMVDGSFHYRDAYQGAPWMIRAEGGLTMFDHRLATAYLQYQSTGLVDFGFNGRLAFGPASLEGGADGWVETQGQRRFNVNGMLMVCVDSVACARANAVLSSLGAAGCITVTVMSVPVLVKDHDWTWWQPWKVHWESHPITVTGGAGYTWQTRKLDLMAGSCSIGRWQLARPAQAGQGGNEVDVAPGQPAVSFRVRGAGAPPKIVLVGPDGRRIESPDRPGGAFVKDDHLLAENPDDDTTSVMVVRPAGGRWRVEAKPGSAPILDVAQAEALPEPTISGGVGGRGHRRTLGYAYAPQPGQKVTFVERGPRTQQTLGVARGRECREAPGGARRVDRDVRCGRLRFTPGAGPAGVRTIEAIVEQDGKPRGNVRVASYRAPAWRRPAKPRRIRMRRAGRHVRVTWKGRGTAHRYDVVAHVSDGRRLLLTSPAKRSRVRVPKVRRADGVRVTIRGLRIDNRLGRQATARLKPREARAPKPRKRSRRAR